VTPRWGALAAGSTFHFRFPVSAADGNGKSEMGLMLRPRRRPDPPYRTDRFGESTRTSTRCTSTSGGVATT
jgi:hypothetical protein